jgi:hypothetical protein
MQHHYVLTNTTDHNIRVYRCDNADCGDVVQIAVADSGLDAVILAARPSCEETKRQRQEYLDHLPKPPPTLKAASAIRGPGDHLHDIILERYGKEAIASCKCKRWIRRMNRLGPSGCRKKKNLRQVVERLRRQAVAGKGWTGLKAHVPGAGLKISQIVLEAIERCEKEQAATATAAAPPQLVDVVIPLSNKSKWQDNELRFALRSLEKNLIGLGRIFVVGHKPPWLQNVVHIPAEDTFRRNKDANLITKVLLACDNGVSEKFIRQSDDQCLLRPSTAGELVPRHVGPLAPYTGSHGWLKRMERTRQALQTAGKSAYYFDTHVPTLYDREAFRKAVAGFDYTSGKGLCINTLYVNGAGADATGSAPLGSERVSIKYRASTADQICEAASTARFLGYNDGCLSRSLKAALLQLFPTPSKYESDSYVVDTTVPTVVALIGMSRSGSSCVAGMLHALGVSMGTNLRRADRHNKKGYFEDREMRRICGKNATDHVASLRNWLIERTGNKIIGVKNGRLGNLLKEMCEAWPSIKFVVTERPTEEIVASWARTGRRSEKQARKTTTSRLARREADLAAMDVPTLRLPFADTIADPAATVEKLIAFCEINPTPEQRAAAIAFVDPALKHQ